MVTCLPQFPAPTTCIEKIFALAQPFAHRSKKGNAMQASTQVDYKILSRTKARYLEEDIAEWTADGYRLVGGLNVGINKTGQTVFYQAVARE
jgi:hypothetical protein